LERGPIGFSEISVKEYKASEKEIKGRELSYKFDELRNEKTNLQIEYDEFKFDQLNPKDRILRRREYKDKLEKITSAVEKAESEMNKIYGW